jgi:class 3 adenylate cyclase
MRLRRKITVAFFLVSSLVSLLLAVFLYRFIEKQLRSELRTRLRDIALIGSHSIDTHDLAALQAQTTEADLPKEQVTAVENSAAYRHLFDQLNQIRDTEPDLITYVYVLQPTSDADTARFVADADIVVGSQDDDTLSHFNTAYPVGDIPLLKQALAECKPQVEPDFVWDPDFHVYSVSGYFPIGGDDTHPCTAVIGVDITDKNMRAALNAAGGLAIKISLAMIALALLVSVVMGTILTRSLLALSETVKRFSEKDFAARTSIRARDEIGQLGSNFNQMAATIQEHSENLENLVHQRTSELYAEKENSERLLLNVLPQPIAERLKQSRGVIVDRFEAVSVLFADIVGFTVMSQRMVPEDVVNMLDVLFSVFDRLAEEHGLEKIKTIGDAYMVVAGIPEPVADHAHRIARMAIDMNAALEAYAKEHGRDISIRIGIASGSVVAGVIGRKKFIYDLWGDTVNTASRMESHGVPGRIHVTEPTAKLLEADFDLESRGTVEVKGKGAMKTYLLIGEKKKPLPSAVLRPRDSSTP